MKQKETLVIVPGFFLLGIVDCGLPKRIADCGLSIADCGLVHRGSSWKIDAKANSNLSIP
jgi:hypothetical protein